MKYTVTHVSRGGALVTDGTNEYRVDGEGLHGDKDSDADFVLYRDSIRCITCGDETIVRENVSVAIIEAIVAKFSESNMKVDVT